MNKIINFQDITDRIIQNPSQWVLILGDRFSYTKPYERKEKILTLAKNYKEKFPVTSKFYQDVENRNYISIADTLFGDVWNGISFLDDSKWEQMKFREQYAKLFSNKEQINIENAEIDIGGLLKGFSGFVLTICQDEVIETFWENENSMLIDENVWTPYSLATSPKWNSWRKYQKESISAQIESYFKNRESILVKMYGSSRNWKQMLLSKDDFELYYPEEDTGMPVTKLLLQELFKKNLFFIGADTFFLENSGLPFAPGICKLLQSNILNSSERYIILEKMEYTVNWESFNIIPIRLGENFNNQLQNFQKKIKKNIKNERIDVDELSNRMDLLLDEEAKNLFWELYIRRPKYNISETEKYILEKEILKIKKGNNSKKNWSKKAVYLLSMVANNQADFYDLREVLYLAKSHMDNLKKDVDYEVFFQNVLCERLGEKSLKLLQILYFYGDGFPLGFLHLLSIDNDDMKVWKRAGFQLANSGIYIRQQCRRDLHKKMDYADSIMMTVGKNPNKVKLKNIIDEVRHQLDDSYFYPLDKKYFDVTDKKKMSDLQIQGIFERMFRKLLQILMNKQEGYNHIRSLLETEIHTIIPKIKQLEDKELQWKPALLYYLLRESRVLPYNIEEIDGLLNDLLKELDRYVLSQNEIQQILYKKMMIFQTFSIIKSQSSTKEGQNKALDKCKETEDLFKQIEYKYKNGVLVPKYIFDQGVYLHLLECKVYGRISTLAEMERCEHEKEECQEQGEALKNMYRSLIKAKEIIEERGKVTGNFYEDLWAEWYQYMGEYWFKMSQYQWENRRYSKVEKNSSKAIENEFYKKSLYNYKKALEYYKKYPYQYLIQRADVMRNIADLYCQRGKSEEDINSKMGEQCYSYLAEAYELYRSNADLHGIADVLQSMGNAEDFSKMNKNSRSSLSFYKVAEDIYISLGDLWSSVVVSKFKEGIVKK